VEPSLCKPDPFLTQHGIGIHHAGRLPSILNDVAHSSLREALLFLRCSTWLSPQQILKSIGVYSPLFSYPAEARNVSLLHPGNT
jgi:hypothetical protein